MNILCWLWPLISGIICGILGYLLGRLFRKSNSDEGSSEWKVKYEALVKDLDTCKKARLKLESDLDECRKEKLELENKSKNSMNNLTDDTILKTKVSSLESSLTSKNTRIIELEEQLERVKFENESLLSTRSIDTNSNLGIASSFAGAAATLIPFNADAAKVAFGKKIKQDDLKIVEGIGPKIEELFHNFNIKTWKHLSETSIEKCQEILNSGGERYKIHNPGTWPKQAQLAYEGKWIELVKWQDDLDGGKA